MLTFVDIGVLGDLANAESLDKNAIKSTKLFIFARVFLIYWLFWYYIYFFSCSS